jgi:hypothetical protein
MHQTLFYGSAVFENPQKVRPLLIVADTEEKALGAAVLEAREFRNNDQDLKASRAKFEIELWDAPDTLVDWIHRQLFSGLCRLPADHMGAFSSKINPEFRTQYEAEYHAHPASEIDPDNNDEIGVEDEPLSDD